MTTLVDTSPTTMTDPHKENVDRRGNKHWRHNNEGHRKHRRRRNSVRASSAPRESWRDPLNLNSAIAVIEANAAAKGHNWVSHEFESSSVPKDVRSPSLPPRIDTYRDPLGLSGTSSEELMSPDSQPRPLKRLRTSSDSVAGPAAKKFKTKSVVVVPARHHQRHVQRSASWQRNQQRQQDHRQKHSPPLTEQRPDAQICLDMPGTSKATDSNAPVHVHRPANKFAKENKARFRYGNYCRYYGKRLINFKDERLECLKAEWFRGKSVLDIGCNDGSLTLNVCKRFEPQRVLGIDIDKTLVQTARQKMREMFDKAGREKERLPQVFMGGINFMRCNYVLDSDASLDECEPLYDVIIAFSITKWIHVNWGDAGLKRFFKRIYKELRPGGILLLEAQPWSSYKPKCRVTQDMRDHFDAIKLRPDKFIHYLMSPEVGFQRCENISSESVVTAKGFTVRPIRLLQKAPVSAPVQVVETVEVAKETSVTEDM